MSDLKEETTVDNTQPVEETVSETKKAIDPSLDGLQLFYEKNKNTVNYVGGGLALIIGVFCFFKFYYLPGKESEAANEIFWAESYFEKDSFDIALKGGKMVIAADGQKQMLGFEQIADDYSMTKTGNLANYYAGICYLRTGKFEQAIEWLSKYSSSDPIISSIALGAIGDSHMELNKLDEALKYYLKAADNSSNSFTSPLYLKKAGLVYELKNDYANALEVYNRIKKEYNSSTEARDIDRSIGKVKTLGNL